ncbi:CBS domain-containing protein [Streptomyces sp. NPDC050658]|uniref:CBS domain-containing protein n=1 Tax=unclassified Streptomyces TaxID=2593676 RepID=UPI003419769F
MTTAREIMTPGAECIGEGESALDAARWMKELGTGALPICGTDDRLKGMLTDRDIVTRHKVRRLPVIDKHRLVGIIAQADVARALPNPQAGDLLEAISAG